jgi:hypothetical protein
MGVGKVVGRNRHVIRHVIQQALQLRKPLSQISNFNLRTGILITGCMACGGGSTKNAFFHENIIFIFNIYFLTKSEESLLYLLLLF